MWNLLSFFEDEQKGTPSWVMIVVMVVMVGALVLVMIIPNRRQKKRMDEMMSKLTIGSVVTTIGGIVGEVVELDDSNVWLRTGTEENATTVKMLRQAIHSVAPAPGTPEAEAIAKAEKEKADEIDEIK